MILQNWDPFKKNKREALIKKMVLKRLGDEIRPISYQKFVSSMNLVVSGCDKNIIKTRLKKVPGIFSDDFQKTEGYKASDIILGKIRIGGIEHFKRLQNSGNILLKIPD